MLAAAFVLALLLASASACSIHVDEGCDYSAPVAQRACNAGHVLRGSVVAGPTAEEELHADLNVTVRVVEVINTAGNSSNLAAKAPFEAVITGFAPCCVCGTEPPAASDEELFFFVSGGDSCGQGNCTNTPTFMLSSPRLGDGDAEVTAVTREAVMDGMDAQLAGTPCGLLYCLANPTCVSQWENCPATLQDNGATYLSSSVAAAPPRQALALFLPLIVSVACLLDV